jgi:hypothetical protein
VRLALLPPDVPGHPFALVLEGPRAAAATSSGAGSGQAGIGISRLPLEGTLLATAVQQQTARFIPDCRLYMQVRR